jgi:hypothetical protein
VFDQRLTSVLPGEVVAYAAVADAVDADAVIGDAHCITDTCTVHDSASRDPVITDYPVIADQQRAEAPESLHRRWPFATISWAPSPRRKLGVNQV